jgi:hypothetical protein
MNGRQDQIVFVEGAAGIGRVQCQLGQKTLAGDVTGGNLLGLPGMFAPRYQECFAIGNTVLLAAGGLSDFWSDHPQANRLRSLLTIGHVNSDALGLC